MANSCTVFRIRQGAGMVEVVAKDFEKRILPLTKSGEGSETMRPVHLLAVNTARLLISEFQNFSIPALTF